MIKKIIKSDPELSVTQQKRKRKTGSGTAHMIYSSFSQCDHQTTSHEFKGSYTEHLLLLGDLENIFAQKLKK